MSQSLADIFNASIQSGIFQDDFMIARVAPIFKEGEKGDVSNYRPISVLCTVARVFEKLLCNQLHQYLVQHMFCVIISGDSDHCIQQRQRQYTVQTTGS